MIPVSFLKLTTGWHRVMTKFLLFCGSCRGKILDDIADNGQDDILDLSFFID